MRLSGERATETAVKQGVVGRRVIHLATHGFFLGTWCESQQRAAPSSRAPQSVAINATGRQDSLLLAGLAFTGANRPASAGSSADDGLLLSEEIAALDLRGVEWAVLSACDTGTGVIRAGEGLFGLRRLFQVAGAGTVIVSLWPVEDDMTRQWMTAAYRHRFVEGEGTAEALRGASIDILRTLRQRGESTHPARWASFIAAGAW
jgi:CHAT domain-containing protein